MTPPTPAPQPRRRMRWFLAGVVVLAAAGGAAWYLAYFLSRPTEFTDAAGIYTARFPNPPTAATMSTAEPAMLKWGERVAKATVGRRDYAVVVLDGLNPGDQEVSPANRDAQADTLLVLLASNAHGDIVHRRPATHDGHAAREVVIAGRDDGKVMAVRVVVGERCAVRMSVHGPGDKSDPEAVVNDAAGFFDSVKLGPAFGPAILDDPLAVSATDLAAAYKSDPAAADGRYKGRWVRVTGKVTETANGSFDVDTGVAVRRAAKARMNVSVRSGAPVTATGKCEGLAEGGRVTLTEAIVLRPLTGGAKKE